MINLYLKNCNVKKKSSVFMKNESKKLRKVLIFLYFLFIAIIFAILLIDFFYKY